jgi:predicted nucleic acid-binding protein
MVAALRSSLGASNLLLRMALQQHFQLLLSVPLFLEYESVLTRQEQLSASGLSTEEVHQLLDTILDVATSVHLGFFWPQAASDEDDSHILTLAVMGNADVIVTHNIKHFTLPAAELGINLDTPNKALSRIRS